MTDQTDRLALTNLFARMTLGKKEDEAAKLNPSTSATVLVVDDSQTQVHALCQVLEQTGYRTIAAFDGQQGVAMARAHKPDLIIMDIVMPVMNGFQATRALRKDASMSGIPIIIVSGTQQASDKVWGIRIGANDFMAKPIQKSLLLHKINKLLVWRRRQALAAVAQPVAP